VREYALSLATSEPDLLCAQGLRVELHRYVAERTLLRVGLCSSLIDLTYAQFPDSHVALARNKYRPAMEEHFTRLPGVSSDDGAAVLYGALNTYGIAEPDVLASRFLQGLHGREFPIERMSELPTLTNHIGNEFTRCIQLVQKKIGVLASTRLP
jgi:hypothetical protein